MGGVFPREFELFHEGEEMPFDGGSRFWMGELARGKSALSGEGERTFGQNSNFRSGDVGGVMMGLLRTSKVIKSL